MIFPLKASSRSIFLSSRWYTALVVGIARAAGGITVRAWDESEVGETKFPTELCTAKQANKATKHMLSNITKIRG